MSTTFATIISVIKDILLLVFWTLFVFCIGVYVGEKDMSNKNSYQNLKENNNANEKNA